MANSVRPASTWPLGSNPALGGAEAPATANAGRDQAPTRCQGILAKPARYATGAAIFFEH